MSPDLPLKAAVWVACIWEVVALPTRLPTISQLCGRHRWLPPLIVAGLAAHLYPRKGTTNAPIR